MEQKAVCGGFLVGDGLEMNGKVLSATGGSGGGKIYLEDDDGNILGAGKDIDSIMLNGGLLMQYSDGQHTTNTFRAFNNSAFYPADGHMGYKFSYVDNGALTVEEFKIVGDDLIFIA